MLGSYELKLSESQLESVNYLASFIVRLKRMRYQHPLLILAMGWDARRAKQVSLGHLLMSYGWSNGFTKKVVLMLS